MGSIEDQPPPQPQPERVPVWNLVLVDVEHKNGPTWERVREDMRARDAVGRERYGTPLTTHNGRNHLVDAYQEALDLAVYLRAALEEVDPDASAAVRSSLALANVYQSTLTNLHALRSLIAG